jgi:hypothetical protein
MKSIWQMLFFDKCCNLRHKPPIASDDLQVSLKVVGRVARFVLVQHTKMGENLPKYHNWSYNIHTKWPKNIPNVIKYTNIFHCKTLQYLPTFNFFGSKKYHLATLVVGRQAGRQAVKFGSSIQVFKLLFCNPIAFKRVFTSKHGSRRIERVDELTKK